MPETLYEVVVEVEERVLLVQESCQLKLDTPIVTGNTGEKVGGVRGGEGRRWEGSGEGRGEGGRGQGRAQEIFCCVVFGVHVVEFSLCSCMFGRVWIERNSREISSSYWTRE